MEEDSHLHSELDTKTPEPNVLSPEAAKLQQEEAHGIRRDCTNAISKRTPRPDDSGVHKIL